MCVGTEEGGIYTCFLVVRELPVVTFTGVISGIRHSCYIIDTMEDYQ